MSTGRHTVETASGAEASRATLVTEIDRFLEMRDEWNELVADSRSDPVFLSWEWLVAWWNAYGTGKRLAILRVDRDGRLIGLAPLYYRTERMSGFGSYRVLSLLGDGSGDSDYLDVVVRNGEESTALRVLGDELDGGLLKCDLLRLNEVPESSPALPVLRSYLERRGWFRDEAEVPCAYVALPPDWEAYLLSLKPRMRTKTRSLMRQLEESGQPRFDLCSEPVDLETRLESLFELHRARWAMDGKPGVFVTPEKRSFYREMAALFLARGWLRFYSLSAEGGYVAHQYCFERNRRMYLLQEGFDPRWMERGVGNLLRACVMRDCIRRGVETYDFLGGVTAHKISWGADVKKSLRLSAAPRGAKGALYFLPRRSMRWAKFAVKGSLRTVGLRSRDE